MEQYYWEYCIISFKFIHTYQLMPSSYSTKLQELTSFCRLIVDIERLWGLEICLTSGGVSISSLKMVHFLLLIYIDIELILSEYGFECRNLKMLSWIPLCHFVLSICIDRTKCRYVETCSSRGYISYTQISIPHEMQYFRGSPAETKLRAEVASERFDAFE